MTEEELERLDLVPLQTLISAVMRRCQHGALVLAVPPTEATIIMRIKGEGALTLGLTAALHAQCVNRWDEGCPTEEGLAPDDSN